MLPKTKDDAIKDIPLLRSNLIALGKLSSDVFKSPVKIPPASHLRFMMLSYSVKQIEHANSILKLEPSVDTVLIARSMLEGMVQLLWAMKARRRPLLWRAFALVNDWRTIQKQKLAGQLVDSTVETRTLKRLRRYHRWFLNDTARKAIANGKPLPTDPYVRNWYGEKEFEIFRDVGGETIYKELYGPFSEWHHWRTASFGRLISFDASRSEYNVTTTDPSEVAMALATGFQCLCRTMQLVNNRLGLGIGREIQKLRRQQLAINKPKNKAPHFHR